MVSWIFGRLAFRMASAFQLPVMKAWRQASLMVIGSEVVWMETVLLTRSTVTGSDGDFSRRAWSVARVSGVAVRVGMPRDLQFPAKISAKDSPMMVVKPKRLMA